MVRLLQCKSCLMLLEQNAKQSITVFKEGQKCCTACQHTIPKAAPSISLHSISLSVPS